MTADTPNEASVRRYWQRVWSEGDPDAAADFYAAHYRQDGVPRTPAEFSEGMLRWRSRFPDTTVEVNKLFSTADGRVVVSRVTYRATHLGDLRSIPATGRKTEVTGIDIFEFNEDGKVVDHWHEADHYGLYTQLGAELQPGAGS
ncbi:MAG TPA: ester cyclase [Deinococcales bacterium]|nr:ester cyclase [Deinococcales bacterium]